MPDIEKDHNSKPAMTPLSSDAPIQTRDDDLLGYWPFAESVAKGLTRRSPDDGFVVGIQAQWGMGKTSVVNLILQAIKEEEATLNHHDQTKIESFNPWLFAGLENLASGYLKQLGKLLQNSLGNSQSKSTQRFLKRLIGGGGEFLGVAAAVGVVAATGGAAAPAAPAIKNTVKRAADGIAADREKSVEEMLTETRRALSSINHRIIFVIDDLDRLTSEELRQILTLIKTFGSLPKITYLLVYDRQIIDTNLRDDRSTGGMPSFREKIVQAEFDLPPPSNHGLRKLLESKLSQIFSGQIFENDPFWFEVWRVAFKHYLRSPRDVVRFMNSISVSWPAVEGEVYFPDLLAIELFRHFERGTYEAIRDNAEYLTGRHMSLGDAKNKIQAETILSTIDPTRYGTISRLIASIFPIIEVIVKSWEDAGPNRPLSGRRLRDPDGFEAFFGFLPASGAIPMSFQRLLSDRIDDTDFVVSAIKDAERESGGRGTSRAASLLDAIDNIVDAEDKEYPGLLLALLRTADTLFAAEDETSDGWYTTDNRQRVSHLVSNMVAKWPEAKTGEIAKVLLTEDTSLGLGSYILSLLASADWRPLDRDFPRKMERAEVQKIGETFCGRLREASEDAHWSELMAQA